MKNTKKSLARLFILGFLVVTPSLALASTFTIGYGTLGSASISDNGGTSYRSENITDFSVTSNDPLIHIDTSKAAYCVDLYHTIGKLEYDGKMVPLTVNYFDAAKLLNHYGKPYDDDNDNDNSEELLQLSIWETLYETNGTYSLIGGNFKSASGDNTYLDTLSNLGGDIDSYYVLRLYDMGHLGEGAYQQQDLLVKVSSGGPPVPIPGAIWLLGSGLLGLVGIRRHKAC
jgi:hypothetical protein